jgi:hypothetical protein
MSTTFHPQIDGQTEQVNQTIETFLRAFVNIQQNDWPELMPLALFAYNNSVTSANGMTRFYAKYGYHPSTGTEPTETNTLSVSSVAYGHLILAVFEHCKKELEKSSERIKKYADQDCLEPPSFKPSNLVMLNGKNIKNRGPARKLEHKIYRPYEILDIISPTAVRPRLPKT